MLLDVPVDPDAETARGWAESELSDPIYHEQPNLLRLLLDWVLQQLADAQGAISSMSAGTVALAVGAFLALGIGIALVVAGPVRRARRAHRASVEVFEDDSRTADQLRSSADALAAKGRWSEAVLDRFRAIMRSLEQRVVLDERPGRTAHEAAEQAGARLPSCADDLRSAARLFDDVCYGDASARPDDDARLRELDQRVAQTRPVALAGRPGTVEPEAAPLGVPR